MEEKIEREATREELLEQMAKLAEKNVELATDANECEERTMKYQRMVAELNKQMDDMNITIKHMAALNAKAFEVIVDLAWKLKQYEDQYQKKYRKLGE